MKRRVRVGARGMLLLMGSGFVLAATGAPSLPSPRSLPEPLREWRDWATWNDRDGESPPAWRDARQVAFRWPSILRLEADAQGATGRMEATLFRDGWLGLPGGEGIWPVEALANGAPQPVLERDGGLPAIRLPRGHYRVEVRYAWPMLPQRITVAPDVGVVSLTLEGQVVEFPVWDAQGALWFQRHDASAEADRDFLSVTGHAVIEDGIPLRWHGEVELVVSGKSREEVIGYALPEGWRVATITAQIPAALDEAGRLKAQVRPGKWTIRFLAFRLSHPEEIRFAENRTPAFQEMLVGFRAKSDFRLVEVLGMPSVDVTQTTFPADWRGLPVYRWETGTPFRLEERMRGMGARAPEGLNVERSLWLDENGGGLTFKDHLSGVLRESWRLDAAPEQDLGSVRAVGGQGLLITRNPRTGAPGVELRSRQVRLEAVGRLARVGNLPASGWMMPVEAIQTTLHLPPGYRLLALHGADWVQGDWLTAWSLLDLFLLLIFTIAVIRLWGFKIGAVACLAFVLSYQEPDAPRFAWLMLLMPLALLRVVEASFSGFRRVLGAWKWGAALVLGFQVACFSARQIQQTLYPQLERIEPALSGGRAGGAPEVLGIESVATQQEQHEIMATDQPGDGVERRVRVRSPLASGAPAYKQLGNLMQDAKARIQTGPGIPEWTWRRVRFGWSGPVDPTQRVRVVLIPLAVERMLSMARVGLSIALFFLLLGRPRATRAPALATPANGGPRAAWLGVILLTLLPTVAARAQFPDASMIETLRARLLETSDAFPGAADLAALEVTLAGNRLSMTAEFHVAARCAAPLPGRLPAWSPLRAHVEGSETPATLRRNEGFLWIVLDPGIHRVRVEGLLPAVAEWEMAFLMRPRRMTVEAPDWAVSGIQPTGAPEAQVLFVRRERQDRGEVSYEHLELLPMVAVHREVELGLVWQVRTTVRRLSPPGRALSLRVPLLPGEQVLTAAFNVKDGFVDLRLGAQESASAWQSELPVTEQVRLATRAEDAWVEQWQLSVSPVWNVTVMGLAPVFESAQEDLHPVWAPWPGETVELLISRPEAIAGATVTLHQVRHEVRLGPRQRSARLDLTAQASLGEEFTIGLPSNAEVTDLTIDGQAIPVRMDGGRVTLPLRPATQNISLGYRTSDALGFQTRFPDVRLPVDSANVNLALTVPANRWLLWARGPLRGPAVRFWVILIVAMLAAFVLGRLPHSPLAALEWMLLALGLTQAPLAAGVVVAWLFLLAWRGRLDVSFKTAWRFNALQLGLAGVTAAALVVLVVTVAGGLLGNPEMFVLGNGSSRTWLLWYQARSEPVLPQPGIVSVSIWWYRLLMLLWALWLSLALVRWLRWGWMQFSQGGCLKKKGRSGLGRI